MNQRTIKFEGLMVILLLFFTSFTSCREDVDLIFKHEPKLCFNCILNPDSSITADLTLSQAVGSAESFVAVSEAKVELFENNHFLGILTDNGDGKYSLNYKPKTDFVYKIRIEKFGYPISEALTKVPNRTKIEFSSVLIDSIEHVYKNVANIYDVAGNNQYWYYTYSTYKDQKFAGTVDLIYEPFFDDFNKVQETESSEGFLYRYMVRFNNEFFDGKIVQINSWATKRSNIYTRYKNFMNVDNHYDKYLKTSIQALMLKNEEIPMSEPIQIYSNVSNGYGIFGSCVVQTFINYPIKKVPNP